MSAPGAGLPGRVRITVAHVNRPAPCEEGADTLARAAEFYRKSVEVGECAPARNSGNHEGVRYALLNLLLKVARQ